MEFSAELMQKNVAIVHQRWPHVLEQLPEPDSIVDLQFELVEGTPLPTLRVNGIQIHGAYDPEAEARMQAREVPKHAREIWVYGLGQAFLPGRLLLRKKLKSLHIVLMNREFFVMNMALCDMSAWLLDERVELHLPRHDENLRDEWLAEPAGILLADEHAMRLRDQVESAKYRKFINDDWRDKSASTQILERLSSNEKFVAQDPDVAGLFGAWDEKVVVVAAPGPTLSDGLERIRRLQADGALVLAVDMALPTLVEASLRPDVVISVDKNWQIFGKLRESMPLCDGVVLVYMPVVSVPLINWWRGPRYVAYHDNPIYKDMKRRHPKASLWVGGSVVHAALDLARLGGASEIRLCGVDFGFPGQRYYAQGTGLPYLENLAKGGDASGVRRVRNGDGEFIETLAIFNVYRKGVEDFIRALPRIRFVNMSRKGAYIQGARYEDEL